MCAFHPLRTFLRGPNDGLLWVGAFKSQRLSETGPTPLG